MKTNIPYFKELKYAIITTFLIASLLFMTSRIINAGVTGGGSGTSTPEGTAVLSTGEAGGTKYLREDGDGTCSWQTPAGGGDMTNAVEGVAIAASTTTLGNTKANLASPTFTGTVIIPTLSLTYGVGAATGTYTGAVEAGTLTEGGQAVYNASETPGGSLGGTWASPTIDDLFIKNDADDTSTGSISARDLVATYGVSAATLTLTGTGQSSLNAGLIINEDGGNAATDELRVETNTEIAMIKTDANDDSMVLGGTTNGWKIAKGGIITPSGTCSVALPNSGTPTVDAAGETAIDTTTGVGSGIRYYTDAEYFEPAWKSKSFVIISPSDGDDFSVWRVPYAVTIKAIHVLTSGGTSVVGGLDEGDANGANAVAVDADITGSAGTNANDDGSLTNAAIDSGDYINWHTTTINGSPDRTTITFDYIVTP